MAEFEEIKKRREMFDALRPEDYMKSRGEPRANKNFWMNIDDDERWLLDEVDRLRAELAKFVKCDRAGRCQAFWSGYHESLDGRDVYHKVGE